MALYSHNAVEAATSHNSHNSHNAAPMAEADDSLLAAALMTSRDGTARYWDTETIVPYDVADRGGWASFRRMAPRPRAMVLAHEAARMVAMEGEGDVGRVVLPSGAALVTLTRPRFDDAFVREQMGHLRDDADLRADRLVEIQLQRGDLLSFFAALSPLGGEGRRRTLELHDAMMSLIVPVLMRLKMHFDLPRPVTLAREVQPVIDTPGHGAWPSGHATEAFATAYLLAALAARGRGEGPDEVPTPEALVAEPDIHMRLAARIAANRTVAGVHYPTDSMAGAVLGLTLAEMLVRRLQAGEGVQGGPVPAAATSARAFDGTAWDGPFDLEALDAHLGELPGEMVDLPGREVGFVDALWTFARDEWGA